MERGRAATSPRCALHERVRALIALPPRAEPPAQGGDAPRGWRCWRCPATRGWRRGCTARTVDAIWHAAGDRSADFSWYTKRATLAFIYSTCFMYWLQDASPEDEATLAFLDRRLADAARLGRLRRRAPPAAA